MCIYFSFFFFLTFIFPSLRLSLSFFFYSSFPPQSPECSDVRGKRRRKDADTVDMTPSVLIALFTNTPLPGVLGRSFVGFLGAQTHSQMFPFLIPLSLYIFIHSFIHLCQREGTTKRSRESEKKKLLGNQKQQQLLFSWDPIRRFLAGTIDARSFFF